MTTNEPAFVAELERAAREAIAFADRDGGELKDIAVDPEKMLAIVAYARTARDSGIEAAAQALEAKANEYDAVGDDPRLVNYGASPSQAANIKSDTLRFEAARIRSLKGAAAPDAGDERSPPDLVRRAYMGLLVLRTMCKARLPAGLATTEELLADLEAEYPALPALSALRGDHITPEPKP